MDDFVMSFPQLFQALKTLPATVRLLNDAFNQKDKVAPFDDAGQGLSTDIGTSTESACLKQLGVDDHSSRLPVKELDAVTVSVDEDVHVAVAGIAAEDVGHYAAERMMALSHVGGLVVQQIPHTVVQAKHDRRMP